MRYMLLIALCVVSLSAYADGEKIYHDKDFTNIAKLQGLNKITARVSEIDITIGELKKFGNLEIELEKCWHSPPEEKPENKALLKIWESIPGEEKREIFYGWMFSSTPAVSALENAVYDITVLACVPQENNTQEN